MLINGWILSRINKTTLGEIHQQQTKMKPCHHYNWQYKLTGLQVHDVTVKTGFQESNHIEMNTIEKVGTFWKTLMLHSSSYSPGEQWSYFS